MTHPASARSSAVPAAPDRAVLFEIAWEVCHQVGGIYQVLRSKSQEMSNRWGDHYVLVGPLIPEVVEVELEAEPANDWLGDVVKALREEGLEVVHGRWLVPGRPRALLLDPKLPAERLELIRHRMQRDHGIPPARGNALVDDVLGFGEAVQALFRAVQTHAGDLEILAHFHEWLGSSALAPLRAEGLRMAMLFTTHATSLGRYLASSGEDLYGRLDQIDPGREAERFGIDTQHAIETLSARTCDVFTTVSPITAEECLHLLGREPDIVTPNGLDVIRFDIGHEFQTLHAIHKEGIHRFVMGHFFPNYAFDLDETLYFFSAGRFETRNKGFDLCLEAAARLNAELRDAGSTTTVVLFIVTSRSTRSLQPSVLHSRGLLDDLDESAQRIGREVGERLFRRSAAGEASELEELTDDYWNLRHRRLGHAFRSKKAPLVCTHVLDDPDNDPILAHLRHLGLQNAPEDRVKVVYHPEFISSTNPLWGMDYEQFVRGCHLGLFPSQYEPWGYTPLECVAMGVPAITSDLAGFGRYVGGVFPDHDAWGLGVLDRRKRSYQDAAADLAERMLAFCRLDRGARVALRNEVVAHSRVFDWRSLAAAYHEAHDKAHRMLRA